MDFNFTSDNESEASSEFSLEDSRELVAELQRATQDFWRCLLKALWPQVEL